MNAKYELEELAAEFHEIYVRETIRQGNARWMQPYAELPENIKELDRVLARYVLSKFKRMEKDKGQRTRSFMIKLRKVCKCGDFKEQHLDNKGKCVMCWGQSYPPACEKYRFNHHEENILEKKKNGFLFSKSVK